MTGVMKFLIVWTHGELNRFLIHCFFINPVNGVVVVSHQGIMSPINLYNDIFAGHTQALSNY